ncbi:hypothetical protein DNTS_017663 [Danionella cerebrum]|nr:hypothetical protein DNTS_017663 [Danionella translucida]
MTFCSPVVAQSHYVGKVHAKNLRMQSASYTATEFSVSKAQGNMNVVHQVTAEQDPNRFCTICQASFNNPLMAQQHYSGKKHKKHINKQKLMETYGTSTTPASKVKGYPCDMCNIELNSVEQYNAHIGGSKHRNQLKGNKEQNFFPAPTNYNQDDQYHESQLSLEDPGEWDSFNHFGGIVLDGDIRRSKTQPMCEAGNKQSCVFEQRQCESQVAAAESRDADDTSTP